MVAHMRKTTLNIDEAIMARLKEEAIRRKTTMGALVEAGIRTILAEGEAPAPAAGDLSPLPMHHMGEPLVDITNREALYEALDRERDERLYGMPATPPSEEPLHARQAPMRAVAEDIELYDEGPGTPDRAETD